MLYVIPRLRRCHAHVKFLVLSRNMTHFWPSAVVFQIQLSLQKNVNMFRLKETIMHWNFCILIVVCWCFVSAHAVEGRPDKTQPIKCYQCNSFYDKGCSDFFDNKTYPLIPCSSNATMCRKIIQESEHIAAIIFSEFWFALCFSN